MYLLEPSEKAAGWTWLARALLLSLVGIVLPIGLVLLSYVLGALAPDSRVTAHESIVDVAAVFKWLGLLARVAAVLSFGAALRLGVGRPIMFRWLAGVVLLGEVLCSFAIATAGIVLMSTGLILCLFYAALPAQRVNAPRITAQQWTQFAVLVVVLVPSLPRCIRDGVGHMQSPTGVMPSSAKVWPHPDPNLDMVLLSLASIGAILVLCGAIRNARKCARAASVGEVERVFA